MMCSPVSLTTLLDWGSRTSHWWYKVSGLQHIFGFNFSACNTVPLPLHGPIWDLWSLLSKLATWYSIVAMHSQTQPTPILLMERKILYNHDLSIHLDFLPCTKPFGKFYSCIKCPWLLNLFFCSPSLLPPLLVSPSPFSLLFASLYPFPPCTLHTLPFLYSLLYPSPSPLSSSSWSGGQHHSEIRKSQLEENSTNLECTRLVEFSSSWDFLIWNAPEDNNAPITTYWIIYCTPITDSTNDTCMGQTTIAIRDPAVPMVNLTDISPQRRYRVTIRGENAAGMGLESQPYFFDSASHGRCW